MAGNKLIAQEISRRQALSGLAAGASVAALTACTPAVSGSALASSASAAGGGAGAAVEAAPITCTPQSQLETFAYNLLGHEPGRATGLGVDIGQHTYLRSKLQDTSQAGQDAYAATLRADLEEIRSTDTSGFDADTRTNFEVVESGYSVALDGFAQPYGDVAVGSWRNAPYVVIQNVGAYLDMPRFLENNHPLNDANDAEAYTERLEAYPQVLQGELERINAASAMGVTPPDFLLDKAIAQMERTIADTAGDGGSLATHMAAKSVELGLPGTYQTRAKAAMTGPVMAMLKNQLSALKSQRASAKGNPGMWAQPHGDEWYQWALRASTTTTMSPDEVHEQGLEELAALQGEMDPILKDIGYSKGTVGERMQGLSRDPRYKFAPGDPGRKEIMDFIHQKIDWITAQMPRAFNTLVNPNLEVKRLPLAEEPGAPGAYGGAGSKDGTIPGRMWINLRTTDLHRKYDLADLTFHETIPGHVWEGEFSNRLPLIRSILAFNAFSEGWALYGEQLADELGAYDDFKVGRLGYLQSLAFRACRMVVDTGLHHKRWSREQAVDFFVTRNGSKRQEVESEVDRYCSWPGQACGYKVGHSQIVKQRARAQSELGAAYDLKAFDDAVVLGGNAPLDVMANNVGRYIASAKG